MCRQVIERLNSYYNNTKVQPYHPYPQAQLAGQQMDEAHAAFAKWLNVETDEVYFGPSTSQNSYVLANAMFDWLNAGDEIIVTNQDHEANGGAWRRLEKMGIKVTQWSVAPETGSLDIEQLKTLFTANTKLLVFPHCSNILGEINPVSEICELAKAHQVRTVVDGVSYAGHGLPDVQQLGADIYMFSLYKVYGTHQGIMVVRNDMAKLLANQGHYFNGEIREKRLTPAGPDHAQIAAAIGVCEYFEALYQHHFDNPQASDQEKARAVQNLMIEAEKKTLAPLLAFFKQHPKITIIGPDSVENRAPTVAIVIDGHSSMALAKALGDNGIMCGAGHFYSLRLIEAMQIDPADGVLRFSLVHYTELADIEKLIKELSSLID